MSADELLELVHAARDWLDEARAAGALGADRAARLPVAPAVEARAAGDVHVSSAWGAIASASRKAEVAPDVALATFRAEWRDCRRCGRCAGRQQVVFGAGPVGARLAVIGEGPGLAEDRAGAPFVGPHGQTLDKMLENVLGLSRADVFLLDAVMCHPANDRALTRGEVDACRPGVERQLELVQPDFILAMGGAALAAVHPSAAPIARSRGSWFSWRDVPVLATLNPAHIVESLPDKRLVFEDLKSLRAALDDR